MPNGTDQQIEHQQEAAFAREHLMLWMDALEAYARDWDAVFGHRPHYFTQEFWYLLVNCTVSHWRGRPLTVSAAAQHMKSGSNRTREERIKKAVVDGYLLKRKGTADGRESVVVPTDKLSGIMVDHFSRTLKITLDALEGIRVLEASEAQRGRNA